MLKFYFPYWYGQLIEFNYELKITVAQPEFNISRIPGAGKFGLLDTQKVVLEKQPVACPAHLTCPGVGALMTRAEVTLGKLASSL